MTLPSFLFFLSGLGITQGLLISLILVCQRGKKPRQECLLALLFSLSAVVLLLITLVNSELVMEGALLKAAEYGITLVTGPVIYLYFRSKMSSKPLSSKRKIWHTLPAVSLFALCLADLFHLIVVPHPIVLCIVHMQAYVFISGYRFVRERGLRRMMKIRKDEFWVPSLLLFFLILGLSQWLRFSWSESDDLKLLVPAAGGFGYYTILLAGFYHVVRSRKNHALLRISEKQILGLGRLEKLIETEEPFLQPDLTLNKLAYRLELHPNQLSALIHRHYRMGFAAYINHLRITKAKQLLLDKSVGQFTIEAIGQSAGFRSRSGFYRAFKKEVGQTPLAFQRENGSS